MITKEKPKKFIRFYDSLLYIRLEDCGHTILGNIKTRAGGLTREQKLKAVAANGKWIEI